MLRGEVRLGQSTGIAAGVRAFDVVAPIEDWGLRAAEAGWEAFLFHRDYRDYYLSKGIAGYLLAQPAAPLQLGIEVRRDWQTSVEARDPWTLLRNDQVWRPNPPIDDGHYVSVVGAATLDTRNDSRDPTSGWYLRGTIEASRSRDAVLRTDVPTTVRDPGPAGGTYRFTRVFLDARRYTRVSQSGRLNLRMIAGGWLGGDPLPLQRRLSLGGPDPVPGYGFRPASCSGTITAAAFAGTQVAACDRVMAFQVEYRGHLSLNWSYNPQRSDDRPPLTQLWLEGLDLVVFGNAGQAWLVGSGTSHFPTNAIPTLGSWLADLGLGIDWGGFGVYVAKATTVGEHARFTVRLDHRF
jgi:outer membrane protein assembly factor BamA